MSILTIEGTKFELKKTKELIRHYSRIKNKSGKCPFNIDDLHFKIKSLTAHLEVLKEAKRKR